MVWYGWMEEEEEIFFSLKNHRDIRFETADKCSFILNPPRRNETEGLPEVREDIRLKM